MQDKRLSNTAQSQGTDTWFFNTAQSQSSDTCSFKKIFSSTFLNPPSMCWKFHNHNVLINFSRKGVY
jgi:hypothetical protein